MKHKKQMKSHNILIMFSSSFWLYCWSVLILLQQMWISANTPVNTRKQIRKADLNVSLSGHHLLLNIVLLFLCSPGFLRCVQPVLVSRTDPDSRRNTILEIERRAKSGGHWPQVSASTFILFYLVTLKWSKIKQSWTFKLEFHNVKTKCVPSFESRKLLLDPYFLKCRMSCS